MMRQTNQAISSPEKMNAQAVRLLGRHVTKEKALILFFVTMAVCALPMLLGLRLWDRIPALVQTGILRFDGQDDSMPRSLLVFGVPGLFCILNLIVHIQLSLNQARMTMPKGFVRLMGRWGAPVLSTLASSAAIYQSAGLTPTILPRVVGLALLLLGAQMIDCPQDAFLSLRFSFLQRDPRIWKAAHRLAASLWMLTGFAVLTAEAVTGRLFSHAPAVALAAVVAPLGFGWILKYKKNAS